MIALLWFFLTLFASPFKSKSRLEAENAALIGGKPPLGIRIGCFAISPLASRLAAPPAPLVVRTGARAWLSARTPHAECFSPCPRLMAQHFLPRRHPERA